MQIEITSHHTLITPHKCDQLLFERISPRQIQQPPALTTIINTAPAPAFKPHQLLVVLRPNAAKSPRPPSSMSVLNQAPSIAKLVVRSEVTTTCPPEPSFTPSRACYTASAPRDINLFLSPPRSIAVTNPFTTVKGTLENS